MIDTAIGQGVQTLTMNPTYKIASVNSIYSVAGSWPVSSASGNTIITGTVVEKGRIVTVDFMWDLTSTYTGTVNLSGNGILSVPIRTINEQGVFNGQIVSIQSLYNVTQNRAITPLGFWENNILVSTSDAYVTPITAVLPPSLNFPGPGPFLNERRLELTQLKPPASDVIMVSLTWTQPVKMILSQIDPKTMQANREILQGYHAQVTALGSYHLGEGDLITPQVMRQRDSIVCIAKTGEVAHQLPYFHVERLLRVEWSGGVISDATLVRNNTIVWNSTRPSDGSNFSVQLIYHPTFKVGMDLPNLRYAEDKECPQRLFLKRYDLWNRTGMSLMTLGAAA
jgi:hypothetical protein